MCKQIRKTAHGPPFVAAVRLLVQHVHATFVKALAMGVRPPQRGVLDAEPGSQKRGWQVASWVHQLFRNEDLFHRAPTSVRGLIKSQRVLMENMAFCTPQTSHMATLQPHMVRTIMLRKLRQPLPFRTRNCRCGRPIDSAPPCNLCST